jgi:hypothetical protein
VKPTARAPLAPQPPPRPRPPKAAVRLEVALGPEAVGLDGFVAAYVRAILAEEALPGGADRPMLNKHPQPETDE